MKVHLASSDEPLVAGRDQDAACGKTVPKAVFPFVFDMGGTGRATVSSLLCCQRCADKLGGSATKRYLYALAAGEEALHEGE